MTNRARAGNRAGPFCWPRYPSSRAPIRWQYPPPGSWPGWPDPWQRFWSMIPASFAGAQAWRPPIFLNSPGTANRAALDWSTTISNLQGALPSSAASADPAPPWPPPQSLLGLIPYLSLTSSDPRTKGFFSMPYLGGRFPPDPPVQNVADSDPSVPTTAFQSSGTPAADPNSSPSVDEPTPPDSSNDDPNPPSPGPNLLFRFFNAINPVGTTQAAEGEGPPMSPEMARALAEALHDSAAAAELFRTQDALARYHQAMQDALAYAGNVPSSSALGKLLELSGVQRPEGYEAHHIVAGNHKRADPGRQILKNFDININDPANGVFLPATDKTVNINGEAVHRPLHTYKYMDAVNEALREAKTKAQAIDALQSIGRALQAGGYP